MNKRRGSKTACGVGKGFVQALVPLAGVTPGTEIEVLHALNDPATMVIAQSLATGH